MREFRKELAGREWRWRIWVDQEDVHTEHGFVGGTLQHLVNSVASKYQGSSAEVSGTVSAATRATKMIREKQRSGFVEVDPETGELVTKKQRKTLGQWLSLPTTFRTYQKYILNEPGRAKTNQYKTMVDTGQHLVFLLPPGRLFHFMITAKKKARIYSVRMEEYTRRMPHLVSALERSSLPPRTLFTAYVSTGKLSQDHTLFMSKDIQAMINRQLAPGMRLEATICDTFFWDGKDVISGKPWRKTRSLWDTLWGGIELPYFSPLQYLADTSVEDAKKYVETGELYGLIIYDRTATPDRDHCYAYGGFPPVNSVWTWRRSQQDDFYLLFHPSVAGRTGIMHRRTRTSGKEPTPEQTLRVGKVGLYQMDPDGQLLCYGTCRHGFSESDQELILSQAEMHNGWVGRGRVRFIDFQEATHENVVSRLVDPYFLQFLPEDRTLEELRRQAVAPGLGTARVPKQTAPCLSSSPEGDAD
jgi:hypothetical protein